MSYKGLFRPRNPNKYKGDASNIVWRSTWELKFMNYLDSCHNVIQWSSEEFCIPYKSPIDGKMHRYFPDFWIKKINSFGATETMVVEIKPKSQTVPPSPKNKASKSYINEVITWGTNSSKWKAAEDFCKQKNWKFNVITEKDLGRLINGD